MVLHVTRPALLCLSFPIHIAVTMQSQAEKYVCFALNNLTPSLLS